MKVRELIKALAETGQLDAEVHIESRDEEDDKNRGEVEGTYSFPVAIETYKHADGRTMACVHCIF